MKLGMILFLLVPVLGNVYVLWHVWRMLPLPVWAKGVAVGLMAVAFLLLFVALSHGLDRMPMPLATAVYEVGTSWLIVLLYLFMLFLLLDLGRLVRLVPPSLLADSWRGTLGVLAVMLGLFVYGNLHYHNKVRQPLTLKTDKPTGKPLRVVLMSDLHLGYHNQRGEFRRWVDMVNAERPDLVLIAGDIIDRSIRPLEEQRVWEEFRQLKVPVVACLGNHEYYAGQPDSRRFYEQAGIRLLRDEAMEWGPLLIVGRDDRTNPRRKTVAQLMQGADTAKFTILLDHQPYHLEEAEQAGIDFQFSGHTHHGQVWPISWVTEAVYENAFGSSQRGATRYYVSSGIGIWGGKFRIGTRSEYVVAEIGK